MFFELRSREEQFFNFNRMSASTFDELLDIIKHHITKKNTVVRSSISPKEKLVITLKYVPPEKLTHSP